MKVNTKSITRTGILLALALVIQWMRLPQLITGTAVNAVLLISLYTVGVLQASVIGCMTPIVALLAGIIQPPMAPVVPFIVMSNLVLIWIVYGLRKKNTYIQIILASGGKFLFLVAAVRLILTQFLPAPVWEKVAIAFGVTQLFTALAGGFLAILVTKLLHPYLGEEAPVK